MHLKSRWEESYRDKENHLFYPEEEVIRFVSRYVRRRVGLEEFKDLHDFGRKPRVLALGCGIGRHVVFAHDMELDGYGIDLSEEAVRFARNWVNKRGLSNPQERIIQGSVEDLPWSDGFFDVVISHGVLDSMPFETACSAVEEVHRVLQTGGLFYCDLISGDNSDHAREYSGQQKIDEDFEEGTIQSYFNYCKIHSMLGGQFEEIDSFLIKREDVKKGHYSSRYHLTLRRCDI
jgi:SAM-dependent methyltransferase